MPYKIDKVEKAKLEKEIKLQKQHHQKEHLTHSLQDIGGVIEINIWSWSYLLKQDEGVWHKRNSEKSNLFFYAQLGQKSSPNKHFQMGQSVGNKYKPFDLQELKSNLIQITLFLSGNPEK